MFGHDNEPVVTKRDCEGIVVPVGTPFTIPKDSLVYITQAMGGSFTVYFEGNLLRIAGTDADALGKEPVAPPHLPEDATDAEFEALVWAQLQTIFDPEIPINIVDLGLIYECTITPSAAAGRDVFVRMTVTAPGCGMGEILVQDVKEKIEIIPTVHEARVELVFDPPWNQSMMSEAAQLQTGMI